MAKQTHTSKELNEIIPLPKAMNNIVYEYLGNPFIITLDIADDNKNIQIPNIRSSNGVMVDWGDDMYEYISLSGSISHKYKHAGRYIVHITGEITNIYFDGVEQLIEISQWGNLSIQNGNNAFRSCTNLTITALDVPSLIHAKDLSWMFYDCRALVADFSRWDVRNIVNMSCMFSFCSNFSSDLSQWDVRNVTYMDSMFSYCSAFNSVLSRWDVSNVTNMSYMFSHCSNFSSDLSRWDVRNVTNMSYMFSHCIDFSSDLSRWDVSNVTEVDRMFAYCLNFNSDLSQWNVRNVTNTNRMFVYCLNFNSNMSQWNVRI